MNVALQQFGVPGLPELLVLALIVVIPIGVAYWTYTDAKARDDENAASWGISMFLFAILGLLPALVALGLWTTVRPEKRQREDTDSGPQAT